MLPYGADRPHRPPCYATGSISYRSLLLLMPLMSLIFCFITTIIITSSFTYEV